MIAHSQKFYDRLTVVYPIVDFFLQPQKQKFFDQINHYPYGTLLEIGVGNGSHFKYYKNHAIIGIDTSQAMLDQARKHTKSNIQLLRMNGENLSFPNERFDYVTLSHVLAVVQDPEQLLAEVYRVLKPGGKLFILNHFTPDNWLKYVDRAMSFFSRRLYFKSVFNISGIRHLQKFMLMSESNTGPFSYFKILIYEKKI